MPKSPKTASRKRHGTRKWVLEAVKSMGSSKGIRTVDIQSKVASLSGAKIPAQSVYQALRTLVKRKVLSVQRKGRERIYRLLGGAAPKASRKTATPMPSPKPAPAPVMPAPVATPPEATVVEETMVVHKLVPGEVAILEIGESHLEVASNVHGKLVVERHKRPKKATSS